MTTSLAAPDYEAIRRPRLSEWIAVGTRCLATRGVGLSDGHACLAIGIAWRRRRRSKTAATRDGSPAFPIVTFDVMRLVSVECSGYKRFKSDQRMDLYPS